MELNIVLKNLVDQRSSDGSWWRLNCFAENGDVAQIDVQPEDLARLGAHLTELSLKSQLADQLPAGVPIESRSQSLEIHNAIGMRVVRWTGGGFALHVQSDRGVEMQIRFTPEMVFGLRDSLNREFPVVAPSDPA